MKLMTYQDPFSDSHRFGFLKDGMVVDVLRSAIWLRNSGGNSEYLEIPSSLKGALGDWNRYLQLLQKLDLELEGKDILTFEIQGHAIAYDTVDITFLPPVTDPSTFRDFYAFEQHVRSARKLRGLDMNPAWYNLPIFYFSNPNALFGHKAPIPFPRNTKELDFELEFAVIIANGGDNIKAEDADLVIGGYTILNDWSARDLQREEMSLNLGPAKGKDFASSFGPYLVTPDELSTRWNESGKLDLNMTCRINGRLVSEGNTNDLYHSFPSMIERASMNTKLLPGDYIGSGTVGTGCILELRPENTDGWLKPGDLVTLEVDRLGILENTIINK